MPSLETLLTALTLLAASDAPDASPADAWPGFRGLGTSHSEATALPTTWSEEEGLAWSAEIVGYGQSSPVVWGDLVFVTSMDGAEKERCVVQAHDLGTGALRWLRTFPASTRRTASGMVSRGAPTPVVDSRCVYAFFESGDLVALDHAGETQWLRSLTEETGPYAGNHGVGTSLRASAEHVLLVLDHDGPGYALCVDKVSGEDVWRRERAPRVSWTTPFLSGDALVVSSNGIVEVLDVATGDQRWSTESITGNTVASPTVFGDRLIVGASDADGNAILDLATGEVIWRPAKPRPSSFASPLVLGDAVYTLNKSGVMSCYALDDGAVRWEQRLADGAWASPIAAEGRIYVFGKEGTTTVLEPRAEEGLVLAENELPTESRVYGVAVVQGTFVVREASRLRCLRAAPQSTSSR